MRAATILSRLATLTMMAKKKMKLETSSSRHKRITKKIAGVLTHDFQPYSFVEDRGFKELKEELEPRYEIPHQTTFTRSVIPRIYQEVDQGCTNNRYVDLRSE